MTPEEANTILPGTPVWVLYDLGPVARLAGPWTKGAVLVYAGNGPRSQHRCEGVFFFEADAWRARIAEQKVVLARAQDAIEEARVRIADLERRGEP